MKVNKINQMYILSFLFTLHISLSAYVNSTFLTNIISEKYVGLLYAVSSFVTLVLISNSTRILKNFGNRRFSLGLLIINMIALASLIVSENPRLIAVSFISLLTTNILMYLCIDIFIEHFGNKETIGKTRGIYLTIVNIAWVLSPIVTATIITYEGGYRTIYLIALATMMLTTIALTLSVKNFKDKVYTKTPFLKTYKFLKENRHMMAVTIINFILQFFYSWMVVYTPIYLIEHLGFTWDKIGIIFTIMLVPFVIFGLPVGILIDKYKVKKRTLLYIGFIIISVSTALISFTTSNSLALWALILFATRTGASIIETTSEIYFFTHVKEEDAYLLGLFRDMAPAAYLVAPLFATMIFYFLPFKYLFIILSAILLSGIYYISQLKHNHEPSLPN